MKSFVGGLVAALALAWLGSDASAALVDEGASGVAARAGSRHVLTLAKAKKRKRPASSSGSAGSSKPAPADDAGGDDDDAGKTSSASSDSSDDTKEDAVLPAPKRKKAAPVASDDSDSSSGDDDGASPRTRTKAKPKDESVDTVAATASSDESSGASPSTALEFGVGAKAMFRQLAWTSDGRAAGLGPYNLTPGPETGLWLDFYPAAFGTSGFAANVGLFGRFNYGFGVATTLANGKDAATTFRDFMGGIKVRIPMGMFNPNVSIGYGQQIFAIAQQNDMADLPQLAYQFVRPSAGARIVFSPEVALDAALGCLLVLDAGSGGSYIRSTRFFPKTTAYGIDASASVSFKLTGTIGARGGVDFRQYGLALHPDSTTRAVAGAVDRYIVAWAGLEVVLDGQGGAAGGGGEDEPAKPSKRRRHRAEPKEDEDSSSSDESSKSSDEE